MDEYFEQEIERALKEGRGWTDEERSEYIDSIGEHPLFAENLDEMDPSLREALEEMAKDESDPLDTRIEMYKRDGDQCVQMAAKTEQEEVEKVAGRLVLYRTAVKAYTKGVLTCIEYEKEGMSPSMADTHTAILSNRALAHLKLKNYRPALRDAEEVLGRVEGGYHSKALFRKASALFGLKRWEECIRACNQGIDQERMKKEQEEKEGEDQETKSSNGKKKRSVAEKELSKLKKKAIQEAEKERIRESRKRRQQEAELQAFEQAWTMCQERGLQLGIPSGVSPAISLPSFDAQGISWQVSFTSPLMPQSEIVQMHESQLLAEVLAQLFPFPEDEGKEVIERGGRILPPSFVCSNLDIYFQLNAVPSYQNLEELRHDCSMLMTADSAGNEEKRDQWDERRLDRLYQASKQKERYLHCQFVHTLEHVLSQPSVILPGGIPSFTVFPLDSEELAEFKRKVTIEEL